MTVKHSTASVFVFGKLVELRLIPLAVIGGLVLRTALARQAEKIRRGGNQGARDEGGNSTSGS